MLKDSMTARPDGISFDAAESITDIKRAEKTHPPQLRGMHQACQKPRL